MDALTCRVALDSNAVSYLIEALGAFPDPPRGDLAAEKIALARSFLYRSLETVFCITPTVQAEYSKISDQQRVSDHASWALQHLYRLSNPPNTAEIILRTHAINAYHGDVDDCRIVAECEAFEVDTFVTSDRKLRRAMTGLATPLRIRSGQQYWDDMAIAPGDSPTFAPVGEDPLGDATWWKV